MLTCMMSVCFAADLDQPMVKVPTLRSEIYRGSSSVPIGEDDILRLETSIFDIIKYNEQNNKNTDGFYLGIYFKAWISLDDLADITEKYYGNTNKVISARNTSLSFYHLYTKIQVQYQLDDKSLCDAAHLDYDSLKPKFDKWHDENKPKQ